MKEGKTAIRKGARIEQKEWMTGTQDGRKEK